MSEQLAETSAHDVPEHAALAMWKKPEPAEDGVLYAFHEDMTFSYPLADQAELPEMLEYYAEFIKAIGEAAMAKLAQMTDLPENTVVHLREGENFAVDAFDHIERILQGQEKYKPFMNATKPLDGFGERMLVVRIEGVVLTASEGAAVAFRTSLLAAEKNERTGVFTAIGLAEVNEKAEPSFEPGDTPAPPAPEQGGTIATTLGDHYDAPPVNASPSFGPTQE